MAEAAGRHHVNLNAAETKNFWGSSCNSELIEPRLFNAQELAVRLRTYFISLRFSEKDHRHGCLRRTSGLEARSKRREGRRAITKMSKQLQHTYQATLILRL